MQRAFFTSALTLILWVVIASPSNAENKSYRSLSLEDLLQVRISSVSRIEEAVIDAPAKVKIITKKQIHERGYINLYDILRDLPGVDTQSYSQVTTYNHVAIRGIVGNNRFLIQKDGVRIGSLAGDPIAISDNFPLFSAERVEIIYGPGSALYGADAFTGVINIISEVETLDTPEVGTFFGENNYRYVYAKYKYTFGINTYLNLSGHRHHSDNPDLSEHYPEIYVLEDLERFDTTIAVPADERIGYKADTDSDTLSLRLQLGENFTKHVSVRPRPRD